MVEIFLKACEQGDLEAVRSILVKQSEDLSRPALDLKTIAQGFFKVCIHEHSELLAFFLANPQYYRAIGYNDHAALRYLVYTNKDSAVNKILAIDQLRLRYEATLARVAQAYARKFPLIKVPAQQEYAPVHYIWCGKPEGHLIQPAILDPILMDQKLNPNHKIYYWCDSKHMDYITDLFKKNGYNGERILLVSYDEMFKNNINKIPVYKTDHKLLLIRQIFTSLLEQRKYIYCKDLLAPIILYLHGGYFLDTTVQPMGENISLPTYDQAIFARNLSHRDLSVAEEMDSWMYYSPEPYHEIFERLIGIHFLMFWLAVLSSQDAEVVSAQKSLLDCYNDFASVCRLFYSQQVDEYIKAEVFRYYSTIQQDKVFDPMIVIFYALHILMQVYQPNYKDLIRTSPVSYDYLVEAFARNHKYTFDPEKKVNFFDGVYRLCGMDHSIVQPQQVRDIVTPDGYQLGLRKFFLRTGWRDAPEQTPYIQRAGSALTLRP